MIQIGVIAPIPLSSGSFGKMADNTKIRHSLIIFLVAISTVYSVSADSIKGCGGFVEVYHSFLLSARKSSAEARFSLIQYLSRKGADGKLDYSHITVELQTVDGLVKDSTQCAPNGYYFIPVYDKVPVVVDDSSCNNNEDINFRFTGFTLSGKVLGAVGGESCTIKNVGPSDVNVELLSSDGDPIASILTSLDGSYLFKNIIPVSVHPIQNCKLKFAVHQSTLDMPLLFSFIVELGFANGVVDDIFFVLGYDLKGSVVAQGNPILGVHIYLHSDDVSMVDCPQGFGDASGERKPLCHSVSDADGIFSFKSIPCGKYELIPHYKGENTVFDVSPPVMPVSVEHQHVTVPKKFQVTGFSIGGRVVDSDSKGVEGVKILVDGSLRSVTDKEGYYKLDKVTSNRYTIDAVKEHYKFDKLTKFMVLPNMASLPDISAVSYDICGVVRIVGSGHKAKVALTHGPANVKPQMKHTDDSGTFCFEVPPGEYRLSASAATPKSAPELLFLPAYVDVAVKSPLLHIEFSQSRVNVDGSVTCKEKCGPSVSVALVGVAGDRQKKTVVLTDESNQFHFSDILPGKYRVEVKSISPETASEEDNWCWDRSSIDVNVGTEDIKGIEFKGLQKICVESPGGHELQLSDSCISFGSNSIKIDVSNPQPIHLRAEKYLVKGLINVESSSTEIESELPENFIVDIQDKEGSVINSISAKLASDGSGVYEYYTWANLGEKISFVPRDSRSNVGKKMLFYPKELRAVVSNDGCQAAVSPFTGRLGLYIQGSVSPPLPGVNIKVSAAKDSLISSLKKGEVAVETSTSPDGSFVAGPLSSSDDTPKETTLPAHQEAPPNVLINDQALARGAIMEELQEVTRQYLSCPDPVEAAARRQRVLYGDANGMMEETVERLLSSGQGIPTEQRRQRAADSNPVTPPPLHENPFQAPLFPDPSTPYTPPTREEEDWGQDPRYSDVLQIATQETTELEGNQQTRIRSIIVSPAAGSTEAQTEQTKQKESDGEETLKEFQNKVRRKTTRTAKRKQIRESPNNLRGASSKKRKLSQVQNSPKGPGYHIKRLGPYSFSCQKLGQISVRVFSKETMRRQRVILVEIIG
ncbi:hypothetical protein YC2023_078242 [Brassica napus]